MLSRHESSTISKGLNLIWQEIKLFFNKHPLSAFDASILNQPPTEQDAYFNQLYQLLNKLNNHLSDWVLRLNKVINKLKLQEIPKAQLINIFVQHLTQAFQDSAYENSRLSKENLIVVLQALRSIDMLLPEAKNQILQKNHTLYDLLVQEVQIINEVLATSIHDINNEVLQHILSFLNPQEAQTLRPVSTRFKKLIPLPAKGTPLFLAAKNDHLTALKQLLETADPTIDNVNIDVDGMTPLAIAASMGHTRIVKRLLQVENIKVQLRNAKDGECFPAINNAIQNGHFEVAELLCKMPGININALDSNGNAALHVAGTLPIVQLLASLPDRDINIRDSEEGMTPLHIAALNLELDIVQFLLDLPEVDITAQDLRGHNALHLAIDRNRKVKNNTIPVLKALLQTGKFDINAQDNDGSTILHLAALKNDSSVAEFLLTQPGLDINAKNLKGLTALHIAVRAGAIDTINSLLKRPDIDIHAADSNHNTILSFAMESRDKSLIQYIIDVVINRSTQETPLHESIMHGRVEFVQYLLDHGANHNLLVFCNTDNIIKQISNDKDQITIKQIFTQRYGGIPEYIPQVSLLDLAVFYGNVKIVKLLLAQPASSLQEHFKRALEYAQALGKNVIAAKIQSRIPSGSAQELLERLTLPSPTSLSKRKRASAEDEQQTAQSKAKTHESAPKSQRTRRNTLFQKQKGKESTPSTSSHAATVRK